MNKYEKLLQVQSKIKVSKENFNAFGKYKYRSCEDILEAAKPLLKEVNAIVTLADEVVHIGDRFYVQATATFIDIEKGDAIDVKALAREDETKKGMDLAQVTGSVSSYARKYALNGLFLIDDTKDSDNNNKEDKEANDLLSGPIDKIKADSIRILAVKKGLKEKFICDSYCTDSFEKLNFADWKDAVTKLEARPDKE